MLRGEEFFKTLAYTQYPLRVLSFREQKHGPGDTKGSASGDRVDIHPEPIKSGHAEGTMASLTFPSPSLATIPSVPSPDDNTTPSELQKSQEPLSPLQPSTEPSSSTAADGPTSLPSPSDAKYNEPETRLSLEHEDGQSGSEAASPPLLLHPIEVHEDSTIFVPMYSRPTISTLRISPSAAFSSATSFLAEALSSDGGTTASLATRRRLAVLRLWLRRMRWAIKTVKYARGARKILMGK